MADALTWEQALDTLTGSGAPFEIVERELGGQKLKVFADLPSSFREAFDGARLQGDKTFLVYEDETWSFADAMARIDEIADALVNRYDIQKGDRV